MARAWVRQPVRFPGEEPHSKLLLRSSLPPVEKPCPLGRRWTSSPKPSPRSQQVGSSARSVPRRGTSLQTPPSLFSPSGRETVPARSSMDFLTQALASVTAGGFVSPFGPPCVLFAPHASEAHSCSFFSPRRGIYPEPLHLILAEVLGLEVLQPLAQLFRIFPVLVELEALGALNDRFLNIDG
jgi:hypothetical protein